MSLRPRDKQRARRKVKQPWYVRPETWKVFVIIAELLVRLWVRLGGF